MCLGIILSFRRPVDTGNSLNSVDMGNSLKKGVSERKRSGKLAAKPTNLSEVKEQSIRRVEIERVNFTRLVAELKGMVLAYTALPTCLVDLSLSYLDLKYEFFYSKLFNDDHFTLLVEKYHACSDRVAIDRLKLEIIHKSTHGVA